MLGSLWLIPILCLAGAVVNLALGVARARKGVVTAVGVGSIGAATIVTYIALWQYLHQSQTVLVEKYFTWIAAGGFVVDASFQLDPLSAVMVSFVTFVGFLIHLYSIGYMHEESEAGYARYFAFLNLFMFAMLTLILGSNLPVLFVGWEGVGLCSYLLIGFYFDKEWCATAGKKAFIVNRIGDLGFLLAIFAAFAVFGSVEFTEMFAAVAGDHHGEYAAAATLIGLLLFVGAIGKSAQIPLYVWLPDAMAGPTPVSALIHAATMVTAGVYIVARCNFFYQVSPTAMIVVAVVGGVTAVFAATIGLVQNDIKKVLAYSTVSQLGYMFLAAGVGAYFVAIFHVVTHAFFKACLFLGSGSVIHACGGEQDMRKMGGLKKHMPTTYWTFLAATIAISGIVPFAGFFSKDEILAKAFAAGYGDLNHYGSIYYLLWGLAVLGAVLTAFYMFRLVFMTFHGEFRGGEEAEHHLHESPWTMTLPLQILGVLSIVGGFIGFPGHLFHHPEWNKIEHFLEPVMLKADHGEHAVHPGLGLEFALIVLSLTAAGFGIWMAYRFYMGAQAGDRPRRMAERFAFAHKTLLNKYWVDELYNSTFIAGTVKLARLLWDADARVVDGTVNGTRHFTVGSSFLSGIFDLKIVDGAVNLIATIYDVASRQFRRLQVGYTQGYAIVMTFGAIALVVAFVVTYWARP